MQNDRLDAIEWPDRRATGVDRLTGRRLSPPLDHSGSELPDGNTASLLHPAAALPVIGAILTMRSSHSRLLGYHFRHSVEGRCG